MPRRSVANFFETLPDEILLHIFSYVLGQDKLQGLQDLNEAAQAETRFYAIIKKEFLNKTYYIPNPTINFDLNPSFETFQTIQKMLQKLMVKYGSTEWGPKFYNTLEAARAAPDLHSREKNKREIFIVERGVLLGYIDNHNITIKFERSPAPASEEPKQLQQQFKLNLHSSRIANQSTTSETSSPNSGLGDDEPEIPLVQRKKK